MKIERNKIQDYIKQMTLFYYKTMTENNIKQEFLPNKIINIAISTCTMMNKYPKIKCDLPQNAPKVKGNTAVYLKAITTLLNGVAKYANDNIHIRLKFYPQQNTVKYVLIIRLPQDKNNRSPMLPSSLNHQLNYNFFIIRKMLQQINGKLLIEAKDEYLFDFIIEVNFESCEEEGETMKKQLMLHGGSYKEPFEIQEQLLPKPIFSKKHETIETPEISDVNLTKKMLQNKYKNINSEIKNLMYDNEILLAKENLNREIDQLFLERQIAIEKSIKLKNKIKLTEGYKRLRQKKIKKLVHFNKDIYIFKNKENDFTNHTKDCIVRKNKKK